MIGVQELRTALRLSSDRLDGELQDTIDAAVLDLKTAGVESGDVDALTGMAVKLYGRWQFDYLGKGEQYRQSYEALKAVLALCEEYRTAGGEAPSG